MHYCHIKQVERFNIDQQVYQTLKDSLQATPFFKLLAESKQKYASLLKVQVSSLPFSLPLTYTKLHLYTIPIEINGITFNFLVDTGAQMSAIRKNTLKQIRYLKNKQKIEVGSISGKMESLEIYNIEKLKLGNVTYEHLSMVLLDDKVFQMKLCKFDLINFDGIIGWDLLSQLDFEINARLKCFTVLDNHYKFNHPNAYVGAFPLILAKDQQGKILKLGFDSGATYSWFNQQYLESYGDKLTKQKALGFGVHGKEMIDISILDKLMIHLDKGLITINEAMSGNTHVVSNVAYDGILGNEIIKGRAIRFINSQNKVIFI